MGAEAKHIGTLIREVLAENVRLRMDERYPLGPKYRSQTARVKALAKHSHVSVRTINEVLQQTRGTSIDTVESLANVFNCSWIDLLRGPEPPRL